MHHPPAVHPRHRPGQLHRQPDQVIDRQRLRQPGQARAARVRQHDRPRVPRRLHQLRDPVDTAQPLQHRQLMPQPPLRVRSQRLLADDRAPREEQPTSPACVRSRAARSARTGGSRLGSTPPAPIRHLHARSDAPHPVPTPRRGPRRLFTRPRRGATPLAVPGAWGQTHHRTGIATYWYSRNSSIPTRPPSRPSPDCLTPPNGAAGLDTRPGVEADHADLQALADAQRAVQRPGEDVADQAPLGVVGTPHDLVLVVEGEDRRDGPEDLGGPSGRLSGDTSVSTVGG